MTLFKQVMSILSSYLVVKLIIKVSMRYVIFFTNKQSYVKLPKSIKTKIAKYTILWKKDKKTTQEELQLERSMAIPRKFRKEAKNNITDLREKTLNLIQIQRIDNMKSVVDDIIQLSKDINITKTPKVNSRSEHDKPQNNEDKKLEEQILTILGEMKHNNREEKMNKLKQICKKLGVSEDALNLILNQVKYEPDGYGAWDVSLLYTNIIKQNHTKWNIRPYVKNT
jgi:hypothetical protein